MTGDGTRCLGCPLAVTIPFASFNGDSAPRASAVRLFGEAAPPPTVRGFPCSVNFGISFQWSGEVVEGDLIPLSFSNQVRLSPASPAASPAASASASRARCLSSPRPVLAHARACGWDLKCLLDSV